MEEIKPKKLYRGIVLKADELSNFVFSGKNISSLYEPIENESGKLVNSVGNEYGIYMIEQENVADNIYGNPNLKDGRIIDSNVTFGGRREMVCLPNIGVIYEIDSGNLEIRKPKLDGISLKEKGYLAQEWIIDEIPKENYKVSKIRIGEDILHDRLDMEIDDIDKQKYVVGAIIESRKKRLEEFKKEIEKWSLSKRNMLNRGSSEMNVMKKIFGEDGAKYTNLEDIDISTVNGMQKYLFTSFYQANPEQIDFYTLEYIDKLSKKYEFNEIDELKEVLENNLVSSSNSNPKKEFMINSILNELNSKIDPPKNKFADDLKNMTYIKENNNEQKVKEQEMYENVISKNVVIEKPEGLSNEQYIEEQDVAKQFENININNNTKDINNKQLNEEQENIINMPVTEEQGVIEEVEKVNGNDNLDIINNEYEKVDEIADGYIDNEEIKKIYSELVDNALMKIKFCINRSRTNIENCMRNIVSGANKGSFAHDMMRYVDGFNNILEQNFFKALQKKYSAQLSEIANIDISSFSKEYMDIIKKYDNIYSLDKSIGSSRSEVRRLQAKIESTVYNAGWGIRVQREIESTIDNEMSQITRKLAANIKDIEKDLNDGMNKYVRKKTQIKNTKENSQFLESLNSQTYNEAELIENDLKCTNEVLTEIPNREAKNENLEEI